MKLSVGPVLYYWDKQRLVDFYQEMAELPVDIIYLGETVCAKRRALDLDGWLEIAENLTAGGKQIVLSTLNLIESESDLVSVRRICENTQYMVEANDISAVQCMAEQQLPFYTGPSVNIYNGRTLDFLSRKQLQRWVLPIELGKQDLQAILSESECKPEVEIFAYGHLPLAYSARCFTARSRNLPKDDCQFVCGEYPEGVQLRSQEDQQLFTLNGIQTQSGEKTNLLDEVSGMAALGVGVVRISPVADLEEMRSVIHAFNRARNGEAVPPADRDSYCNGYWFGQPGMLHASEAAFLN